MCPRTVKEGLQEIDVSTDRSGRVTGDRCVHGPQWKGYRR